MRLGIRFAQPSRMKTKLRHVWDLFKQSGIEWNNDNAMRLSAALAYYTIFSLAPLLLLATGIAGLLLGQEAVHGELTKQLTTLLGKEGAKAINDLIANASKPSSGVIATISGIVALLIGATGVFGELKSSLNQIWEVKVPPSSGVMGFLKERLLSFAMVACIGFLLLVSLVINTVISFMSNFFSGMFTIPPSVLQAIYTVASIFLTTFLFALIFKVLPDKKIQWRDVGLGAAVTAILFTVGKLLIGLYLGSTSVLSSFGPSASVILILVWTYYSSIILFYGAEFTEVHSRKRRGNPELRSAA